MPLFGAGLVQAQEQDPRIGNWIEQPGQGSARLRTSYEDLGDGRVRIHLSGLVVEARCDGETYPFTGSNGRPAGPTYSCRNTGPRTVEYTYTQIGREPWSISSGMETVSEDGDMLTHIGVRQNADGTFVENLSLIFVRDAPTQ